jgi:hypothetical protein
MYEGETLHRSRWFVQTLRHSKGCITTTRRAWKLAPCNHEPKPYLARNRDILRATEMLVAAPAQDIEQLRSGTWSTVRFARKTGRVVWVILPGGDVRRG